MARSENTASICAATKSAGTSNTPATPRVFCAVSAVITEASLMYRWGSRADRYEQVIHLAAMSSRANIELRIQRFIDGPYPGMHSMINILGFRDDEPSLVFLETDYSVEEVSKPESVQGYIESFERASDAALEPVDTTGYLERLAKRME